MCDYLWLLVLMFDDLWLFMIIHTCILHVPTKKTHQHLCRTCCGNDHQCDPSLQLKHHPSQALLLYPAQLCMWILALERRGKVSTRGVNYPPLRYFQTKELKPKVLPKQPWNTKKSLICQDCPDWQADKHCIHHLTFWNPRSTAPRVQSTLIPSGWRISTGDDYPRASSTNSNNSQLCAGPPADVIQCPYDQTPTNHGATIQVQQITSMRSRGCIGLPVHCETHWAPAIIGWSPFSFDLYSFMYQYVPGFFYY